MKLKLIDTSAVLHAGAAQFSNFGIGYAKGEPYGFPTGAMYAVLQLFKKKGFLNLTKDQREDIVFCFDRKSFRKDLNKAYKSNRVPNYGLVMQSIELEKGLKAMGFNTFSEEGYEADDIIHSLATKYHSSYEEIEIYGTDRDLAALVDYKTTFISTSKNVPTLTLENFQDKVIPGFKMPFNAIYLFKILFGDKSDIIHPAIKFDSKGQLYFNNTINALSTIIKDGTELNSPKLIGAFIKSIKNEEVQKAVYNNALMVLPRHIDLEIKPTILNEGEMILFLSTFKMKSIAKKFNIVYDATIGNDYIDNLTIKLLEKRNRQPVQPINEQAQEFNKQLQNKDEPLHHSNEKPQEPESNLLDHIANLI